VAAIELARPSVVAKPATKLDSISFEGPSQFDAACDHD